MKLDLFFLLCLPGLISVTVSILRTVPHHYDLIVNSMTWFDAQNYCRTDYTDLATILSDTDWLRLKTVTTSKGLQPYAWTGLYLDVYNWRWTLNDVPLKNTYLNWYPGQPVISNPQEACVVIYDIKQWVDIKCSLPRPFICYNANFTGAARFIPASGAVTWPEARVYCQTHHTDLARAFNSSDNDLLAQIRDIQGDSWIGLRRDPGIWKWADETIASNIPWYSGQPDNYYGSENCAYVYNGFFYDDQCTNVQYFYCHTLSPRKSQTLRLQVKSDRSVFGSAVQSSILEQVKQKMKENGMLKNITVTWKLQTDGNIFHKKEKDEL